MRITGFAIALSLGLMLAGAADAKAAPCKDPSGKFIKCPPPAAAPAASAAKGGPCKDPSGKFIKCPVASAAATAPAVSKPAVSKPTAASSGAGAPGGATAKCKDGTFSMSKTHSGACSHHGGVASWL